MHSAILLNLPLLGTAMQCKKNYVSPGSMTFVTEVVGVENSMSSDLEQSSVTCRG
jgi:hypothetical protein